MSHDPTYTQRLYSDVIEGWCEWWRAVKVILDSSSSFLYQKSAEIAPPYSILCLCLHTEIPKLEVPICLWHLKHKQGEFWGNEYFNFRGQLLEYSTHTKSERSYFWSSQGRLLILESIPAHCNYFAWPVSAAYPGSNPCSYIVMLPPGLL